MIIPETFKMVLHFLVFLFISFMIESILSNPFTKAFIFALAIAVVLNYDN